MKLGILIMTENIPNFNNIIEAHERIKSYIHRTPVLTSKFFNNKLDCNIYFKCENFQKVGAFKYRGATNAIILLSEEERLSGVATHSSGNHAQALALAAKVHNTNATIIMPNTSPDVKINAVKGYGANIIFCEPTLEARECTLNEFIAKSGATFIHPYNNPNIIAGQGTACKELIEDFGDFDIILAPVGGGGLLSGTSIAAKAMLENVQVFAAEPIGADDAWRSFRAGEIIPSIAPKTIADGLLTSLGTITFSIIKDKVDNILTVSEEAIIQAMKLVWERMKIIIEPSSAVALAAIFEHEHLFKGKKVGIILSGGNVVLSKLYW